MNPKVDFYFEKNERWQQEIKQLRSIVLDCGLIETLKWGVPCYMLQQSNIVLIHVFKDYCALLFFKGVLLKDPDQILIQQTENVQSARQMRFTSLNKIIEQAAIIKAYIFEAIEVEKAGLKVAFKQSKSLNIPEELQTKLNEMPELKNAFNKLTPGRQRAYVLHFTQPKQSKTKDARVAKCIPQILAGKGLND